MITQCFQNSLLPADTTQAIFWSSFLGMRILQSQLSARTGTIPHGQTRCFPPHEICFRLSSAQRFLIQSINVYYAHHVRHPFVGRDNQDQSSATESLACQNLLRVATRLPRRPPTTLIHYSTIQHPPRLQSRE